MALKGLGAFQYFSLEEFVKGKRLVFVKAEPWKEEVSDVKYETVGSKVTVQIVEDKTEYSKDDVSNFGEIMVVKVRGTLPEAYKLKPLVTEVIISDIEKAVIWGANKIKNQLSIIAVISTKGGASA